jgi:L-alanine-DL-glutamate epimerase-like enolase superfamily enzyme
MLKVNKYLQGHHYAKSPLDIALWDITAKVAKLPLFKLLGGQKQKDMPLYHSITCVAPDEMVKIAKEKQKEGITQFQVKLGADNNWQVDAERLTKVREVIDDQSFSLWGLELWINPTRCHKNK